MKKPCLIFLSVISAFPGFADTSVCPSSWNLYGDIKTFDRALVFDTDAEGKRLPILWGFDTAWNDYANMLRGIRYAGAETIGVARVSFQPWDVITEKGVLSQKLQQNLDKRLQTISLIGRKVDIALNLDGGEPTIKEVYGGLDENSNYIGDPASVADAYAKLIDATAAAVEKAGYRVVSAAPFNEPDYYWNGTPINVFNEINRRLKNFDEYPRFKNIRISGGNTLNCDEALPWYEELKEFLDEGNTHQLAGDFNHYADFFTKVREDGKYATADELHNVMEAMVGVEYGMQTGIWWGTAEQARGEFCKASSGERLAYAENRPAWSAASVYRSPEGKIQGFLGCSERQAKPSSFNFVSRSGDVFIDGNGPVREFVVNLPGDPNGTYQSELQRNAESVINIYNGEDVQPQIDGDYTIVNAMSRMVIGGKDGKTDNGTDIVQQNFRNAGYQTWTVSRVPENTGGDFSYYFIRNSKDGQSLDDNNWNLEVGGKVIAYGHSGSSVQQWAFEYDGDGYFHIRNKFSALYLESTDSSDGSLVVQNERKDTPGQRWRLIPSGVTPDFDSPSAPSGIEAVCRSASVMLEWKPVEDSGKISYNVLRKGPSDKGFMTIARGIEEASFLDNSVEGDKKYSYKVMATDAAGNRSDFSPVVEAAPEGSGLIACFPFNDSLEDTAENEFLAKTIIAPSFRSGYKDGARALSMRGNQYVQLPYSCMQNEAFTISLRAYMISSAEDRKLFSTGVSEDESMYLTPLSNGAMRLVTRNYGYEKEISTTALPLRTWSHLAVTYDSGTVSLYVDGKLAGESDFSEVVPADRILTYIGKGHEPAINYLSGYISDLRIYNKALSAEEIGGILNPDESGINNTLSDKYVIATEYYNLQGIKISEPDTTGVTIVRKFYSDGSSTTEKLMSHGK